LNTFMQAQILQVLGSPDYAQEIQRGAELLGSGKLLIVPTETVYGVAGILTNQAAKGALQDLRGGVTKPFTVHVARRESALQYLGEVNEFGARAMRKLWPGPIGLNFEVPAARREEVCKTLGLDEADIYDNGAVTLRCVDHPVFFDLVSQTKDPVALISAGPGLQRASDVPAELLSIVEMVFDAGPTRFSKPSTLLRIRENSYEIMRAGVYDERIIDRLLRTTILFVCSGNTCRSPMAEVIARNVLAESMKITPEQLEERGINIASAGSFAMPGARATPQAAQAVKAMGLDLTRHRSKALTVELIHQADVIFTMGKSHARAVTAMVPSAEDKVATLDPEHDIEDPIGGELALYEEVATQLKTLIEKRVAEGILK
jgi:L-threonylcarbamoyladenylate synthase